MLITVPALAVALAASGRSPLFGSVPSHKPEPMSLRPCKFALGPDASADARSEPPCVRNYFLKATDMLADPNKPNQSKWIQGYNGSYVGPVLYANEGDQFNVTVLNSLFMEGTTIHWHGMVQPGTPYMDGVDMVAQCSTPPGFEFQYTFTATPSGTHWYHSHTGVQYGNGLRGVMVVHERGGDWCAPGTGCPEDAQYTNDLPPILLTDYEPISSLDALLQLMNDKMKGAGAGLTPEGEDVDYSDTPWYGALANLHSQYNKGKIELQYGSRYRLRLVNGGASWNLKVSVDEHDMDLIAVDGDAVEPKRIGSIVLAPGDRADVVIAATREGASAEAGFALHVRGPDPRLGPCEKDACGVTNYTETCAYNAPWESVPLRFYYSSPSASGSSQDAPSTVAIDFQSSVGGVRGAVKLPMPPTTTDEVIELNLGGNMDTYEWKMGVRPPPGSMMPNKAVVFDFPKLPPAYYPDLVRLNPAEVYRNDTTRVWVPLDTVVDVVVHNPTGMAHPMHLHGVKFYFLGTSGIDLNNKGKDPATGKMKYTPPPEEPAMMNYDAPVMKDTILVPPGGWSKLRVHFNNAGSWSFHCHIEYHLARGMFTLFEVGYPDEWPHPPAFTPSACPVA